MDASAQALLQALLAGKSAQAVALVAQAAAAEPRILEAFTDVSRGCRCLLLASGVLTKRLGSTPAWLGARCFEQQPAVGGTHHPHAPPQAIAQVIATDQKAAADAFFAVQRQQMVGGGLPSPTSPLASAVVRGITKAITQAGGSG